MHEFNDILNLPSLSAQGERGLRPVAGSSLAAVPPVPRMPVRVRPAVAADLPFIDQLQKMHSHMVGWSPTKQLEANIAGGHVLIAEEGEPPHPEDAAGAGAGAGNQHSATSAAGPRPAAIAALGYCIARDQYMKRDDVGIIYQLNVLPLRQRHLVGATLIKAVFERAAYGCRLFCCWCAQDIQANHFWEALGFVPLAFRTGSRSKQRIHIFWQRRIRQEDDDTPYWFPAQTSAGAVAEDRLVLPIPPGTHWRDAKPVVLPGASDGSSADGVKAALPQTLPGGAPVRTRPPEADGPRMTRAQVAAIARVRSRHLSGLPPGKAAIVTAGGLRYVDRADAPPLTAEELAALDPAAKKKKPPRPKRPRQKHDPKYVAAARELRDRYLEAVNAGRLLLPDCGKYDVSRTLAAPPPAMGLEGPPRQLRSV